MNVLSNFWWVMMMGVIDGFGAGALVAIVLTIDGCVDFIVVMGCVSSFCGVDVANTLVVWVANALVMRVMVVVVAVVSVVVCCMGVFV